ncbi:MAG TPA: ABC transporter ATP-binding protein [Vicinamibacterales bacterium]|nr:ABC transporter ATP-binding protein [Vicinamibacterales bacterium]
MPSAPEPLVRARTLRKTFASFTAVDGIDFDVRRGEAFGFLGPNGAGKTSTMKMIACASPATSGELRIFGRDPRTDASAIKARLGVVPQADNLDLELTVRENLLMYARYFDIPARTARQRAEELLAFVQLTERGHSQVDSLSGGMKRRLTIARALVNQPDLILLDEPTTGLDPQARHLIWERLYRLKKDGATLLLTTHYMDEAEQLCDRLIVMDKGRIVAEGSPRDLIERYVTREVLELRLPDGASGALAERLGSLVRHVEVLPERLQLHADDGEQVLEQIHAMGVAVERALVRRATLEDVFLRITGRTLVD